MDQNFKNPKDRKNVVQHILDNVLQGGGSGIHQFSQKLIRSGKGIYLEVNNQAIITRCQGSVNSIFGLSPEEVVGSNLSVFIKPEDIQETIQEVQEHGFATKAITYQGVSLLAQAYKLNDGQGYGEIIVKL